MVKKLFWPFSTFLMFLDIFLWFCVRKTKNIKKQCFWLLLKASHCLSNCYIMNQRQVISNSGQLLQYSFGLQKIVTYFSASFFASSGIRTWDISLYLYLNLKHDDLDHSATMAGYQTCIFTSVLGTHFYNLFSAPVLKIKLYLKVLKEVALWTFSLYFFENQKLSLKFHPNSLYMIVWC